MFWIKPLEYHVAIENDEKFILSLIFFSFYNVKENGKRTYLYLSLKEIGLLSKKELSYGKGE